MEIYYRKAIFTELKGIDHIAGESDFMEITEWANGEGFDVEVVGKLPTRFQLTWGEYEALKKLIKQLQNGKS